ncbi:MAG: FKBP-type peptidyl-prolyl cis-trans isomerase [Candidatus Eremiobacteraeota bacterium]|nr:FKBP-type peptidyl-prolyl cis-trans isomerase [Candidatus Eremiobacteraeota bacterium]
MRVWLLLLLLLGAPALAQSVPDSLEPEHEHGASETAQWGDYVEIEYVATIAGKKTLDDSRKNGKPYTFQLGSGEVLDEVEKGIVGMHRGDVRVFSVPFKGGQLGMQIKMLDFHTPTEAAHGRDGSKGRPSAWELDQPAIFEFMMRDFLTQPWRFEDGDQAVAKRALALLGVDLVLFLLVLVWRRRRYR